MANRRMISKSVIDNDLFLEMPATSQSLYFHYLLRADDDGFINNPKRIKLMVGASEDDLNLLVAKKFLIPFDGGIVVIRHWRIHNYIQKDRYSPTLYQKEKQKLTLSKTGEYIYNNLMQIQDVSKMDT